MEVTVNESFLRDRTVYKKTQPNGTTTWVYVPSNQPHTRSHSFTGISNSNSNSNMSVGPSRKTSSALERATAAAAGGKPSAGTVSSGSSSIEEEIKRKGGSVSNRYKTELCRPYQEMGFCKYGEKCQFAHGTHDLRVIPKHPKFKTELCRTYHANGYCPYGLRCHFIHNLDEARKSSPDTNSNNSAMSPRKAISCSPPISFTAPVSPSVDSGISSPDDLFSFSTPGKVFDFSGQEDNYLYVESNAAGCGWVGGPDSYGSYSTGSDDGGPVDYHIAREMLASSCSPDPFDFDVITCASSSPTGSCSPMKPAFNSNHHHHSLSEFFTGLSLDDSQQSSSSPSPSSSLSSHRLPVFDDILTSKSDSSLESAITDTVNHHHHQLGIIA